MKQRFQVETPTHVLVGDLQISSPTAPVVILCHGLLNTRNSKVTSGIATILFDSEKFTTCSFDFRGCGESGGVTSYGNYWHEAEDLQSVVEYLLQRSDIGIVSAVIGHSKAASVVACWLSKYCTQSDFVPKVIMLSGRIDMHIEPESRFTKEQMRELQTTGQFVWKTYRRISSDKVSQDYVITQADFEARRSLDMKTVANQLASFADEVLVVHGCADQIVPVDDAKQYAERMKCQVKLLPEIDHFYTDAIDSVSRSVILPFLETEK